VAENFELQSKVGAMDNIHNMSVQGLPAAVSLTRGEMGSEHGEMGSELPIDTLSDWITGTWKSN
jgi:hypothetical protein